MRSDIEQAVAQLEKANSALEPELLSIPEAKDQLASYARAQNLVAFGIAALARKLDDAPKLAKLTGTSIGRAKETLNTSEVLGGSPVLSDALKKGSISLDQATEIARAESSAPGSAKELITVAKEESFQVLRDKARKTKLEAEQHRGLAERQHKARSARAYADELGMINVHLMFEPHIGTPIINRIEAEAGRLARAAKKQGKAPEAFECYLADAYAQAFSKGGTPRSKRPEMVVVVSHEVIKRGWQDVKEGELCKIPGVGPIAPEVAREIAKDAFLNGVFYDGKDLRHFVRFTRHIPVEVTLALELGDPPDFDGVVCVDCGKRFRTQFDHIDPFANGGATSGPNLKPRCYECHEAKTRRDRLAGKLTANGSGPKPKSPQSQLRRKKSRVASARGSPRAP